MFQHSLHLPTQTTFHINRKSNATLITMFTGREERMSLKIKPQIITVRVVKSLWKNAHVNVLTGELVIFAWSFLKLILMNVRFVFLNKHNYCMYVLYTLKLSCFCLISSCISWLEYVSDNPRCFFHNVYILIKATKNAKWATQTQFQPIQIHTLPFSSQTTVSPSQNNLHRVIQNLFMTLSCL